MSKRCCSILLHSAFCPLRLLVRALRLLVRALGLSCSRALVLLRSMEPNRSSSSFLKKGKCLYLLISAIFYYMASTEFETNGHLWRHAAFSCTLHFVLSASSCCCCPLGLLSRALFLLRSIEVSTRRKVLVY